MNKLDKQCTRYLKDSIPVRLGDIAANLSHIASFSTNDDHQQVVITILQESKWFIEWTAMDLKSEYITNVVVTKYMINRIHRRF
jgi:hypothetical protein